MENNIIDRELSKQSRQILDLFGDIQHLRSWPIIGDVAETGLSLNDRLDTDQVCFYRIDRLSYDEDYPRREAFENVLYTLDNEAFNFIYMLTGTGHGVELCMGIAENHKENRPIMGQKLSAVNYGQIIASAFEGNFNGSVLTRYREDELHEKILISGKKYKNAGIIMGIPSANGTERGETYDFQGVDRLINSMLGLEWRIIVVCEPVSKREILELKEDIYELYNRLSVYSKMSVQRSENSGDSVSFGRSNSDSHGESRGHNESITDSKGKGDYSGTRNSSRSIQKGTNLGYSKDHSESSNSGYSMNRGSTQSVTLEIANKHAQDIMKYIDEELLTRMKIGYGKGLFKTSVYYMSDKPTHADRLKNLIISLFQGNKSTFSPLTTKKLDLHNKDNLRLLDLYQNSYLKEDTPSLDAMLLLGRPVDDLGSGMSSYLTTEEISLLAGLPQKEVPGISLTEGVDFGLNQKKIPKEDAIQIGVMVQKGRVLKNIPFLLSRDIMAKHTFIAGVTGSGKTTTCHKLLAEADMPFLVIEPAKTEYRILMNETEKFGKVYVFTLGNENTAPFRINPFELIEGEVISAHVDIIKATFTAAFPMEASMPQILEEAIYKCYEDKGWNIYTNKNERSIDPYGGDRDDSFPTMSQLLEVMKKIVKTKGFSQQMQADYEGSLVSRLSNLTVGSKGAMLDCPASTSFEFIAEHNVILEMEELRSPEDKALFMGFVLSRLSTVIKKKYEEDPSYKHLTLLEEAHRLLSKVEYGDSGSKKNAVETFTDLLAEVRKYGEGMIIVDQVPNKLASEVLKNTNTKIIHKILARDDKEAVGDTMLMDDKQKRSLSALEAGHAIVFSENTDKPVHVYVKRMTDTKDQPIDNADIKKRFHKNRGKFGHVYDDLAIISYYKKLKTFSDKVARLIIDKEEYSECKKIMDELSSETGLEKRILWKEFFDYKERKIGNLINPDTESYIETLSEYFTRLFDEEDIDINELDIDICKKIL